MLGELWEQDMNDILNTTTKKQPPQNKASGPLITCLVCMQSMGIMQLENLQQFLSNKKQRDEYMACSKSVDSSNLIWALFSDFENLRESASRTVDLTKNKLFRECPICGIMFSFFFFQMYLTSTSFSPTV